MKSPSAGFRGLSGKDLALKVLKQEFSTEQLSNIESQVGGLGGLWAGSSEQLGGLVGELVPVAAAVDLWPLESIRAGCGCTLPPAPSALLKGAKKAT